jgi:DNA replication protein
MTEKINDIIRKRDIIIPNILFTNYKKIGLTDSELIFIIYIINTSKTFNPKQISMDLNINLAQVMEKMEELSSKGIIKLESKKIGNVRNECINLDGLYDKLTFNILNQEIHPQKTNIYDIFEKEFGRTISPMEYEIIGAWLDSGTSEETILLALKEATYNGVGNLRYIDKIISEWSKKGIKTKEDLEKSRVNFKQKKETKPKNEILNYDWLNDE